MTVKGFLIKMEEIASTSSLSSLDNNFLNMKNVIKIIKLTVPRNCVFLIKNWSILMEII